MKYKKCLLFIALLISFLQKNEAQQTLFVLKANTPKVAIKDGDEPKTRFWQHLTPQNAHSVKPVVFPLLKTNRTRRVQFFTDLDSMDLMVAPNQVYDFVVVLKGDDTCRVQLSTVVSTYSKTGENNPISSDTIPFYLDKSGNIHIACRVNGMEMSDCIFDSGASHTYVIGDNSDKKLKMQLDGFIEDESVSGLATEQTSSNNHLQIGDLHWKSLPMVYISAKGYTEGGVLVGYNAFEDKVVEVDFDHSHLILHPQYPLSKNDYSPVPMRHTSGGTYLQVTIADGKTDNAGWFLFDTGATMHLIAAGAFPTSHNLFKTLKKIGSASVGSTESETLKMDVVNAPQLKIGDYAIANVPIHLGKEDRSQMELNGTIGMPLLRGFNLLIDYPNSKMAIKPSALFEPSFTKKKDKTGVWAIVSGLILIVLLFFIVKRNNIFSNFLKL